MVDEAIPAKATTFVVQVCLAWAEGELLRLVTCGPGATMRDAVAASGLLDEARARGLDIVEAGVFGKRRAPEAEVFEGDRVELYRALQADPKAARHRRVAKEREGKRGPSRVQAARSGN